MTTEKIATPNRRMNAQTNLSELLLGWKSPKPTVDKEVKEKYVIEIALYALE